MIFTFDEVEELEQIKTNLKKIEEIRYSLADNTSEYRNFCNDINMDFNVVKEIINTKSEYSLLIDCYTFSERLLRYTVYECLEFETYDNEFLNKYMKKKLNPRNFIPSVKFDDFKKELNSLRTTSPFLLNKNHSSVKIYDEMVKSRHRYAHANDYPFSYDNYKEVIDVLEYLVWESKMFLNQDSKHKCILQDYENIMEESKKIKKIECNKKLRYMSERDKRKIDLKSFRDKVRKFHKEYGEIFKELNIFNPFIENIQSIARVNFNINSGSDLSILCRKFEKEYH